MSSIHEPIYVAPPAIGLVADVPIERVGLQALSAAQNVLSRDGVFQTRPGLTTFADDVNQRPMGYIEYLDNTKTQIIVLFTDDAWWHYNIGTEVWDDISGATTLTAGVTDFTAARVFQTGGATTLYGVNGADVMQKWTGTGNIAAAGGSPPKARAMAVAANRMLLGNLLTGGTVSPVAVDVSAFNDPESGWGATQTVLLADTAGHIVNMKELGSLITAIYKQDAIYLAIATGGLNPFRFEMKQADIEGPASVKCVQALSEGEHLYFATDGDIKSFDGVSVRSFDERFGSRSQRILKHVRDTANFTNIERSWGLYDARRREAWFFYPEQNSTDPNLAIMVNVGTGAFWPMRYDGQDLTAGLKLEIPAGPTIGELIGTIGAQPSGQTIGEYGSSTPRILLGESGGQSYQAIGDDDDGTAIAFYAETGAEGLRAPGHFKTLHEVEHLFEQAVMAQNVDVKIGYMNYGETRSLTAAQTVDIGSSGPYSTGFRQDGRLFTLRLEGSASLPVVWRGSNIHLSIRGRR